MKIIGHSGRTTLLLEAEATEVARIVGVDNLYGYAMHRNIVSSYHDGDHARLFPVGTVIEVSSLWKVIEHERARPGVLKMAADQLRGIIAAIEGVDTLCPGLYPKPEEPQK